MGELNIDKDVRLVFASPFLARGKTTSFFSSSPFLGMTSDPPINHACTLFLSSSRDLGVWGQLGKNPGLIYNTNPRNLAS